MNPTPPHEAKTRYLKDKPTDVTGSSRSNDESHAKRLPGLAHRRGRRDDTQYLPSDEIQKFEERRLEQVKTSILETDTTCLEDVSRSCERSNAVPRGMHELVRVPKPSRDDGVAGDVHASDEGGRMERREDHLVDIYSPVRPFVFSTYPVTVLPGSRTRHIQPNYRPVKQNAVLPRRG